MPVTRKREQVRANMSYSPVAARDNPMLGAVKESAGMLAQKAANYARVMTVEAEETAKALAKAATFNTGATGLPELPENLAAKMGGAARRTFDATLEARFIHHMSTSVKMRLAEIANRNLNDPEAFIAEAEGALAEMSSEVPEQYRGTFQEVGTGQLVDHAASIGYRQGVLLEKEREFQTGTMIADATAGIIENVRIGDQAKAGALIEETIALIEAQPMSVMNRGQKDAAIEDLYYQVGLARLITEGDLQNADPSELMQIHADLVAGTNPALAAYFTRPGETAPDPDQMVRAGQHVMQLMGVANQRAEAERRSYTDRVTYSEIASGQRTGTKEEKEIFDAGLSGAAQIRDSQGNVRPIQPEDWLYVDEQTQADMVQAVKEAGFLPASLDKLFRSLSKSSDPEALHRAALLYRDLREQPTGDGTVINMTGGIDERLVTIFGMAEDLHGDGDPGQESIEQAIQLVTGIEQDRWTPQDFATRMQNDRGYFAQWFRQEITAENVDKAISAAVGSDVFDANGIEARDEERRQAERVFKSYLELGMEPAAAMETTRQSFIGRYAESAAMGGRRSWAAPEKHFADAPARGFMEALGRVKDGAGAATVSVAEWLAEVPNAVIPNFLYSYSVNWGGDWGRASTWEVIAHNEIAMLMQKEGMDVSDLISEDQLGHAPRFLKPGRDYELRLNSVGTGGKPTYNVYLISETGARLRLPGRLDMAKQHEMALDLSDATKAAELDAARRSREADAEMEGVLKKGRPLDFFLKKRP